MELDVQLLMDLLKKEDRQPNSIGPLVSNCKAGLREIPMVCVQHCFQKANKCTDTLARRSALLPQDFVVYLEPLTVVALLLSLDYAGVTYDRFVSFS